MSNARYGVVQNISKRIQLAAEWHSVLRSLAYVSRALDDLQATDDQHRWDPMANPGW